MSHPIKLRMHFTKRDLITLNQFLIFLIKIRSPNRSSKSS